MTSRVWVVVAACSLLPLQAGANASPEGAADELRDGKAAAGPEITFVGYRVLPGGRGTLFVELSETAVIEVSKSGQSIEYKMMGARVPLKNNKHPLLLSGTRAPIILYSMLWPDLLTSITAVSLSSTNSVPRPPGSTR